jgi:hypothetical protein
LLNSVRLTSWRDNVRLSARVKSAGKTCCQASLRCVRAYSLDLTATVLPGFKLELRLKSSYDACTGFDLAIVEDVIQDDEQALSGKLYEGMIFLPLRAAGAHPQVPSCR